MAIVVQKSAGGLAALVAGNEFYTTVAALKINPVNDYNETITVAGSATYINFTPTAGGDFLGVILCLYNNEGNGVDAKVRSITVELEENVPGWTSRASKTFSTDDFIPDNTWSKTLGLIDVRFAAAYTITAAAATWRLKIYHDGTGAGTFYLHRSENTGDDNIFHIVYIDSVVSLTTSDVLVLTDKITMDDDLTLEKADADSGSQRRMNVNCRYYSIYGCIPNTTDATIPQIYVPSTAAADYTLTMKGAFYISSYEVGILVGEDTSNPLPTARTFTIYFSDNSATNKTGFLVGGPLAGHYGKLAGVELYGTKPTNLYAVLADDAASGQADIKVTGDVTAEWSAGDFVMIGGAQYQAARRFRDYYRNIYLEIDSLSYSAPDTTITLKSNLTNNHYANADTPAYVCYCERNIVWKGNDTTYTNESQSSMMGAYMKLQGVRIQDTYRNYFYYGYTSNKSTAQQTASKIVADGCHFHDNYVSLYLDTVRTEVEIKNCTSSSAGTGIAIRPYNTYIVWLTKCTNGAISDNILNGRVVNPIYINATRNYTISGNHINGVYGLFLRARSESLTISDNSFYKNRAAIRMEGVNESVFSDNIYRDIYYDSNYAVTQEATHGIYCMMSTYSNLNNYSENDDSDDAFAFLVVQSDAKGRHTWKNAKFGSTFTDGEVAESAAGYRDEWVAGAELKFEDFDEASGDCRAFFTNGYIVSTGTGLGDTESRTDGAGMKAWRMERYFDDEVLELELTTPVGMANEQITVSVYCKVDSADYDAGTYNPPKLSILGAGITTAVEDEADTTDQDWQLLSVSGTPTEAGQLTITLSIETDASGADSYVYWDDMYVSYRTPLDLGLLDLVYRGLPISPPLTSMITAGNVWSELMADNVDSGSMGEAMTDMLADTNELQADWTNDGRLDTILDAIKAKTDNLPVDPADQSLLAALIEALKHWPNL